MRVYLVRLVWDLGSYVFGYNWVEIVIYGGLGKTWSGLWKILVN
jgi:hypothetical protein